MELNLPYKFKNPDLLEQALTHRSHSSAHYERLEFLGDSILGAAISKILYEMNPKDQEGDLTKTRSSIVNEKSLSEVAIQLGLHQHIRVGKSGEKDQVYTNPSVLADVLEALIAAIYIDSNFDEAFKFIFATFEKVFKNPPSFRDYKSELQIIMQHKYKLQPVYKVLSTSGPEHRKTFKVEVQINGKALGCDEGSSKKEAEQNSAKQALLAYELYKEMI